jgi:TusA-related sulfurtransferase
MADNPNRILDTSGLTGDEPLVEANRELDAMAPGEILECIVTDPDTAAKVAGWLPGSGASLAKETDIPEMLGIESRWIYYLKKD